MADEPTDDGEPKEGAESKTKVAEEVENTQDGEESASSVSDTGIQPGYRPSHVYYGEDYGEGYYIPPPSIIDIGQKESEETFKDKLSENDELGTGRSDEASEEIGELKELEEDTDKEREDEEDVEKVGQISTRTQMVERLSQQLFGGEVLQPREKTESEIKFEVEHREVIEEEMRKVIQGTPLKEPITEKRKPLEKTKTMLTDVDISGLYPQPKTVISEVSFAFDEDEEGEKSAVRAIETDADVIKVIANMLRELAKSDPQTTCVKNIPAVLDKIQKFVEEAKGKKTEVRNVQIMIDELLPDLKVDLKTAVIQKLIERLSMYEKVVEAEEDEGEIKKTTKKETQLRDDAHLKRKGKEKVQKVHKVEEKPEAQEKSREGEKPELLEMEKIERVVHREEKDVEVKLAEFDVMDKTDWELLLTHSEKKLVSDPMLLAEMEKYIQDRKIQLMVERKMEQQRLEREERYKSKDPEIMLENLNLNVTMKFILNSGETFTCAYRYFMTFKEIKEDLSGIFKVPPDVLIIYRDEAEMKDGECAHDLEPKIEPFESVTFRLLTLDNDRWRLKSSHLELPIPDIITCTVETGQDHRGVPEYREVVVEIEQRKIKKPFVGGYRNISTGVEYHHAFSQSAPREPTVPYERMVSTDTQTAQYKTKCIDTDNEKSTQMSRSDYFISTEHDKIITSKPYVDYETWLKQKDMDSKILLIQRYVRAMIIRKFIKKMSQEYRARKAWEKEQEAKRVLQREIRVKQDIINMVYPKTKADFEALYAMVERWRKAQVERIGKLKTEAPRKAELCAVLEKEIKLLEAIEVHRIAVAKEQRKKKELGFLEKVSQPVTWTGYRGMTIQMDTLKTQRARELRELYLSLSRDDLNYQDRIELLISIKYALRMSGTRLADDLSNLLNRECEMLIRGVNSKKLEYLRRRIDHLFIKYFKEPDFNPEVAKYDPDYNREPLKQNVMFCKMCHQMKMYKEFGVNARDVNCNVCQSCRTTYNIAVPRIDLNPHRYILKCVRREEQKRNCYSSCAFILQDEDMRFLVENIWHSRSAISENDNLMDLRMPRWDTSKDWTPWNCILLTEDEAKAHVRSSPSVNYERHLVGEVISKHQLAKRHFQQMFATEERLRDSGKWANVVDIKKYVPPPIQADLWDLTEEECTNLKRNGRLYQVRETRRKDDNYVKYI